MAFLARFLTALPLLIFSPLVMAISACALALVDLLWSIFGARSSDDVQRRFFCHVNHWP
jgi:hypothetical protein